MLKKLINKPLSNKDIMNNVNHNISFIVYPYLKKYDDIDDVFNGNKSILILYLQNKNFGHWTCINKLSDNLIEFFDPYGFIIDQELKFNTKKKNKLLDQSSPILSKLLINSKYKLSYNEFSFQDNGSNINTCGRHCVVRMNNLGLSLLKYKSVFDDFKGIYSPDEIVTIMTYDI